MQTQTFFTNPQTVLSNGQFTGIPWNDPANLLTLNGSYASTPSTSTLGSDVVVGNFIFTDSNFNPIPPNSLISGIEISFTGYRGVSADPATALEIYAYDNTSGNNFFYLLTPVFASFTTSPVTYYFGSSSFLFNHTWTADQINNIKLRLQGNGQLFIDNVQVRITYTPPASSIIITQEICESIFQAQPFRLIAPVSADSLDVNWLIDKFETSDGVPITNADIGAVGIAITTDQGTPNEENGYVTSVLATAGNQRIITVSRGWSFRDPNLQTAPLRQHGSGAKVEIANSIQFYDIFLRKCQIGTLVSAPISTFDEGLLITDYSRSYNFIGEGVFAFGTPAGSGGGEDITVVIPGFATVPVILDNTQSFCSGSTQVDTLTVPFAVGGVDRWMIVQISLESTQTVLTATYNGVPMVFDNAVNQAGVRTESWILTAPDLGTNDFVFTTSGLTYIAGNLASFTGADQTTPWTSGTAAGGNSATSTGTHLTTTANSVVLHLAATELVGINYSAGGGETIISSTLSCVMQGAIQTQLVGSVTTVTSNIQLSLPTDWANILGSINGITPPPPIVSPIEIQDEGITIEPNVAIMNFTGAGVTVISTGPNNVEVQIPGGVSQAAVQFEDEGINLGTPGTVDEVDFTGAGVTASRIGNKVTVNIPGGGSGGTIDPSTTAEIYDDFIGAFIDTPNAKVFSNYCWLDDGFNFAGGASLVSAPGHPGILIRAHNDFIPGIGNHVMYAVVASDPSSNDWMYEAAYKVNQDQANLSFFKISFGDRGSFGDGTFKAIGIVGSVPGNWQGYSEDGGGVSLSGATAAFVFGNYVHLKIVYTSSTTTAEFFVDGVSLGTVNTNIPAANSTQNQLSFGSVIPVAPGGVDGVQEEIDYLHFVMTGLTR